MRLLLTFLLVGAVLVMGTVASAQPPTTPFGQSSAFVLNTNRIGFADSPPLVLTSAPDAGELPRIISLGVPMPNPFNPSVTIPYSVGRRGVVQLGIFDLRGRQVRMLNSGVLPEGRYAQQWDGRDNAGSVMPAGIYLVRIKLDAVHETRKISLVK